MKIHTITTDVAAKADLSYYRDILPVRFQKSDRIRVEVPRLLSMGAGILLVEGLGLRDEALLQTGAYGKPEAPGFPEFNLTHGGDMAALVTDEMPVGIDYEPVRPRYTDIAPHIFTEEERDWMNEETPELRFFMLWTAKESVMKALGEGLHLSPGTFSVLPFFRGEALPIRETILYNHTVPYRDGALSVTACHPFLLPEPVPCVPSHLLQFF